ncbi:MAG TPA: GDSL-type esterase/lipase family protein [Polyangiaceae bacterium]
MKQTSLLLLGLILSSACSDNGAGPANAGAGNGGKAPAGGSSSGGSAGKSSGGGSAGKGGRGGAAGKNGGTGAGNAGTSAGEAGSDSGGAAGEEAGGAAGEDGGAGGGSAGEGGDASEAGAGSGGATAGTSGSGGSTAGAGGGTSGSGGSAGSVSGSSGSGGTGGSSGNAGTTGGSSGSAGSTAGAGGTTAGDGGSAGAPDAGAGGNGDEQTLEWLPSWATTIQRTEERNLPSQGAAAFRNNSLRQFVWPTYPGNQIRIQLSNQKGTSPVQIQKVHIALTQITGASSDSKIDAATDTAFTFGGLPGVTIPAGQTAWSDPVAFNLQKVKRHAISMQFGSQVPTEITGHPGARTTSSIVTGDAVASVSLTSPQNFDRWYFINAIEVMAPADAFAVAAFGDSITDGYGILNRFERWPDFLTLAVQNDPNIADKISVLNFGMGGNLLTRGDGYEDAGTVRFDRDVLGRDKIKWVIVLQGVNDIVYGGVQAQPIIDAYASMINKAKAKGVKIFGSTITPIGSANTVRNTVNQWVRNTGPWDALIDFDLTIRDPNAPETIRTGWHAASETLHPNAAGYQAMGNAVPLSLFYPQ